MTWQSVNASARRLAASGCDVSVPASPASLLRQAAQRWLLSGSLPPECYGQGSLAAPALPAPGSSPCLPRFRRTAARRPRSFGHAHRRPSACRLLRPHPALQPAGPQTRCIPFRFLLRYSLLACLLLRESNRASSILPLFIRDFTVPSGTRSTVAISL